MIKTNDISANRIQALYIKSFEKLLPTTIKTVQEWLIKPRVKAQIGNEEIYPQFQQALTALDTLLTGIQEVVVERQDRGDRMRLIVSNVPDRGITIGLGKSMNDLGETLSPLNIQSSYLMADALGYVSSVNKNIVEMNGFTMPKDQFLSKDDKLDQKRAKNILNMVADLKQKSADALQAAILRVEKSLEIWNELGAVEKWVSMLSSLKRLTQNYNVKWNKTGSLLTPTVSDTVFKAAQQELALIWIEAKKLMPEDLKDSSAFAGIDKWLKKYGDQYNYRVNGIEMVQTLLPLIDELMTKTSQKAIRSWLLKINSI